ncbi:uncharacterized protein G2W53_040520 [Senna tora]|uniref:Uncharacterized protein n=1 Tax=Senna tora TaxID=362788 RepID=A0A834W217_9FABA|nr:uncharacterized protein G2W53_040520 [Senna tora]
MNMNKAEPLVNLKAYAVATVVSKESYEKATIFPFPETQTAQLV